MWGKINSNSYHGKYLDLLEELFTLLLRQIQQHQLEYESFYSKNIGIIKLGENSWRMLNPPGEF